MILIYYILGFAWDLLKWLGIALGKAMRSAGFHIRVGIEKCLLWYIDDCCISESDREENYQPNVTNQLSIISSPSTSVQVEMGVNPYAECYTNNTFSPDDEYI